MIEPLKKTTHTVRGEEQTGFWLPVTGPVHLPEEYRTFTQDLGPGRFPKVSDQHDGSFLRGLLIWCEEHAYDEGAYFHGVLSIFGHNHYLRLLRRLMSPEGDEWAGLDDDGVQFLNPYPQDTELPCPGAVKIEGYEGDWCAMMVPGEA